MLVRPRICEDSASKLGLEVTEEEVGIEPFNGFVSSSPGSCMVCSASIVAEGGVLSPKMGFER
jgi:hypothetical protein